MIDGVATLDLSDSGAVELEIEFVYGGIDKYLSYEISSSIKIDNNQPKNLNKLKQNQTNTIFLKQMWILTVHLLELENQ